VEIYWTKKLKIKNEAGFQTFIQRMANRIAQGFARYGNPDKRKKYFTRLKLEVKAYQKTGNAEHLINIANYAHLEDEAPEHPKHHFDQSVESVTRGRV
jgi:hypothetical protein